MEYRKIFLYCAAWFIIAMMGICHSNTAVSNEYWNEIQKDWQRQEKSAGRSLDSKESLNLLIKRGRDFLKWFSDQDWADESSITALENALKSADTILAKNPDPKECERNYILLRREIRKHTLCHPSIKGRPLVFMKWERFTWQMLHEFLSHYYQTTGSHGGGIYILKNPGESFETESLTDKFPRGVFSTLSLSYDAKTIYFAFADFSKVPVEKNPPKNATDLKKFPYLDTFESEYMQKEEGKFHLYKMNLADRKFEQLTAGPNDDFDPMESPDGDLIFISTRRGGYGRCHGHWEPLRVYTLHRLNKDRSVTALSWHETNEWQPTFMNDGRILYTRWDYVDRDASKHHGLWTTNPDGTNSAVLFGNYTYQVNACYQAKAIPNSRKMIFVGGSHHLDVGGPLIMLDPTKIQYNTKTAEDDLKSIENLTPEIALPEVREDNGWVCQQYYHSPWPLSEDVCLTAFSYDPLGGLLAKTHKSGKLGLYYLDRFGNRELLYRDDQTESAMYPIPLAEREKPPVIPSQLSNKTSDTGTFLLSNVYESLMPFPKDRKITQLRIIQLLPKAPGYQSNHPKIGHAYAANARLLLGTIPVEKDGSAFFKAPARVPLYFQAVDETGRVVQSMRSIVYLQPGENRGCVGCHEQALTVQANTAKRSLASLRKPSEMIPGPKPTNPFSYPLLIQPILDRACVSCHDGQKDKPKPNLTGKTDGVFNVSYNQLKPYVRWYEWLPQNTYRVISTFPGECGADISPLSKILTDKNHKGLLSETDRRNIDLWLDMNVPFYGTFEEKEQSRQLKRESIAAPALQ